MYRGKVVHYDRRERSNYGFLQAQIDGRRQKVFFHFGRGCQVGLRIVDKSACEAPQLDSYSRPSREPQIGDELVFWPVTLRKGPAADSWCYAEEWDEAEQIARVNSLTFRYIETTQLERRPADEPVVKWEGYNTLSLLDEVLPEIQVVFDSNGEFVVEKTKLCLTTGHFERKTSSGWHTCQIDPRMVTEDAGATA